MDYELSYDVAQEPQVLALFKQKNPAEGGDLSPDDGAC